MENSASLSIIQSSIKILVAATSVSTIAIGPSVSTRGLGLRFRFRVIVMASFVLLASFMVGSISVTVLLLFGGLTLAVISSGGA